MAKEIKFYGKDEEELKSMELKDFVKLIPARERRSLLRGFKDDQLRLIEKVKLAKDGKYKKIIKTHARETVIIPNMLGLTIHVHSGKVFVPVQVEMEMLGHRLGEYVGTRNQIKHSAPGIGATRSSSADKK
jgi:small subunit ribosomal protein S19